MTYKQHLIEAGMPKGLAALAADLFDLSIAGFVDHNMGDNLQLIDGREVYRAFQAANDGRYLESSGI